MGLARVDRILQSILVFIDEDSDRHWRSGVSKFLHMG